MGIVQQPVSVAVRSHDRYFQHYAAGILTGPCDDKVDHGLLAIGYGSEDGLDYWHLKNSWGPNWGEGGFMRIKRGDSTKYGQCGIKQIATYPVLEVPARLVNSQQPDVYV